MALKGAKTPITSPEGAILIEPGQRPWLIGFKRVATSYCKKFNFKKLRKLSWGKNLPAPLRKGGVPVLQKRGFFVLNSRTKMMVYHTQKIILLIEKFFDCNGF